MKGSPSDMYARYLSSALLPRDRDWGRILSFIALFFPFYKYRTRLYLAMLFPSIPTLAFYTILSFSPSPSPPLT